MSVDESKENVKETEKTCVYKTISPANLCIEIFLAILAGVLISVSILASLMVDAVWMQILCKMFAISICSLTALPLFSIYSRYANGMIQNLVLLLCLVYNGVGCKFIYMILYINEDLYTKVFPKLQAIYESTNNMEWMNMFILSLLFGIIITFGINDNPSFIYEFAAILICSILNLQDPVGNIFIFIANKNSILRSIISLFPCILGTFIGSRFTVIALDSGIIDRYKIS